MCGFMIKTYSWMGNTKPIGNTVAILHKCGMDTKSNPILYHLSEVGKTTNFVAEKVFLLLGLPH